MNNNENDNIKDVEIIIYYQEAVDCGVLGDKLLGNIKVDKVLYENNEGNDILSEIAEYIYDIVFEISVGFDGSAHLPNLSNPTHRTSDQEGERGSILKDKCYCAIGSHAGPDKGLFDGFSGDTAGKSGSTRASEHKVETGRKLAAFEGCSGHFELFVGISCGMIEVEDRDKS